jgi:hypothetical protein
VCESCSEDIRTTTVGKVRIAVILSVIGAALGLISAYIIDIAAVRNGHDANVWTYVIFAAIVAVIGALIGWINASFNPVCGNDELCIWNRNPEMTDTDRSHTEMIFDARCPQYNEMVQEAYYPTLSFRDFPGFYLKDPN